MTTSPNTILYAVIDGWRRNMVANGTALLGAALDQAPDVRARIDAPPGLHVMEKEFPHAEASHELDRLHVVIDLADLGISGYHAADWCATPPCEASPNPRNTNLGRIDTGGGGAPADPAAARSFEAERTGHAVTHSESTVRTGR